MRTFLHVAVDPDQLQAWKQCAAGRDLSLSEWVRMTLDREGKNGGTPSRGVRIYAQSDGTCFGSVFSANCIGTHMAGVWCDGCGGSKW